MSLVAPAAVAAQSCSLNPSGRTGEPGGAEFGVSWFSLAGPREGCQVRTCLTFQLIGADPGPQLVTRSVSHRHPALPSSDCLPVD